MGAEEEGTVEVRKKDKKESKKGKKNEVADIHICKGDGGGKDSGKSAEKDMKKSKKGKKNEVRDNEIYEGNGGGKDKVIESCKSADKECGKGGNFEKKKKEEEKYEVSESSNEGNGRRERGNDTKKDFEHSRGRNDGVDVLKKVEKKKRKREKDKRIGSDNQLKQEELEDAKHGSQLSMNGTCSEAIRGAREGDGVVKVEKKKKKKLISVHSGGLQQGNTSSNETEAQENKDQSGEEAKLEAIDEDCETENVEEQKKKKKKKKKKREKMKENDVAGASGLGILAEESMNDNANSTLNEKSDKDLQNGGKRKREKAKSVKNGSKDPKAEKSKKKVRFSGTTEVFPPSDDNLVRGKRFSSEEDEIVKQAVFDYIEAHCLGEEGLNMVLNCRSHPEVKNCWKEITTCLPHRPHSAIYYRAQVLFRRDKKRKWTEEEIEMLRESHKMRGNQWKELADELGKHRFHVKDTWRRIRHENMRKGRWSQEEYQILFDLVNTDLRMKYCEEKKSKHGMLRDNIPWAAISDKLSTRPEANCCLKWYNQLTSSMVTEGLWADADDYRLIDALFQLDASCTEDVDWDNLLEHRSGDVCRKRWRQMVLHIGDCRSNSFADQVEVLAKRYCPDLLEAREIWDSKPIVP
ncbi:RNA polymerase I termination factor-like [Coffea eugenioides]|uniref:RNA polymerase I termination factor-like n=1 Tax=Coffea eugenioides TaxID=49369 RepID=UPI000F61570B|nr:RNA polymerase I termination factor-like [Coffea eugenioides]